MNTAMGRGQIWGARAQDWTDVQEPLALPMYEAVLQQTKISKGITVLDIG